MRDDEFQIANRTFRGKLRINKKKGLDKTRSKKAVKKPDLIKMYEYVSGNLNNPELCSSKYTSNLCFTLEGEEKRDFVN